jgi:RNA polymerase sigma factor (sigma-70 family)
LVPTPIASGEDPWPEVDRRLRILAVVRQLPERQQQAIALFYLADLPIAVVADEMGCSRGSVKSHLSRARHAILGMLEAEDEQEHGRQ